MAGKVRGKAESLFACEQEENFLHRFIGGEEISYFSGKGYEEWSDSGA